MRTLYFVLFFMIALVSCTDNSKARNFGGKEEITLPKGEKLVMITWKENDLWYLTKPMSPIDSAQTYSFKEKSSMGVWEGTIIVREIK